MLDQRTAALKLANRSRSEMLVVKTHLRGLPPLKARAHAAALLRDFDPSVRPMKLRLLLGALPRVGQVNIQVILRSIDVRSGDRRVDELSDRQRLKLAAVLSGERRPG